LSNNGYTKPLYLLALDDLGRCSWIMGSLLSFNYSAGVSY